MERGGWRQEDGDTTPLPPAAGGVRYPSPHPLFHQTRASISPGIGSDGSLVTSQASDVIHPVTSRAGTCSEQTLRAGGGGTFIGIPVRCLTLERSGLFTCFPTEDPIEGNQASTLGP